MIETEYPELISKDLNSNPQIQTILSDSQLTEFSEKVEMWDITFSTRQISYLSHSMFRFFGKFPAPIARHLIKRYTLEEDVVLDAMVGSGTSAIESLLLNRNFYCADINPISKLLVNTKCTHLRQDKILEELQKIEEQYNSSENNFIIKNNEIAIEKRSLDHWFLPETVDSLSKIMHSINKIKNRKLKNFFLTCFISIIRKVSRATSQQGRLFKDELSAKKDAWEDFEKVAIRYSKIVDSLPKTKFRGVTFFNQDIRKLKLYKDPKLVICHPPYFNVYKFSTIFTLELAWLNENRKEISKNELREFFKIGKKENVDIYVNDLYDSIKNISTQLKKGAILAVMMGDTTIHGEHIPTTKLFLDKTKELPLSLEVIAIRKPKYTEASWVTSQRRTTEKIGSHLSDFILVFRRI